jgi:putative ABC transport system substrate-binding protein
MRWWIVCALFARASKGSYVEGENVAMVYRWAENQIDRLPPLATDLIQRGVNVILAVAPPAVLNAPMVSM